MQHQGVQKTLWISWNVLLAIIWLAILVFGWRVVHHEVSISEMWHVCYLGLVTGFRVLVLIFISSIVWVPIGVLIGMRVRIAQWVQPILQFWQLFQLTYYSNFAIGIIRYHLNVNIWVSPLMI